MGSCDDIDNPQFRVLQKILRAHVVRKNEQSQNQVARNLGMSEESCENMIPGALVEGPLTGKYDKGPLELLRDPTKP